MHKNVGKVDRAIRLLIAIAIAVGYTAGLFTGPLAIVAGVVAVLAFATSAISYCPVYASTGLSTAGQGAEGGAEE